MAGTTSGQRTDWSDAVFDTIKHLQISIVATVPDGGLTKLLRMLEADDQVRVVTLATEEEGVALLSGAWLGGERGALLMQSSGVGNTINMLSLPSQCRIPLLCLVTMRGQWGEFNPWQVPMGQATPGVMAAMGVRVYPVETPSEVAPTFEAAASFAFNTGSSTAVLVGQRIIGAKIFSEG